MSKMNGEFTSGSVAVKEGGTSDDHFDIRTTVVLPKKIQNEKKKKMFSFYFLF